MAQQDAIALLDDDHRKVEQMFARYLSGGRHAHDKRDLAHMICHELTIHAQIEEEIFYPAVRRALGDNQMVDDAKKEHDKMRAMINVIESGPFDDELVVQLQRAVLHHVKEEREEMFDHARRTPGLDLAELGKRLAQRKQELMAHA